MSHPTSPVLAPANRHVERLGGVDAVVRLVDAFYRAMDTRAEFGAAFAQVAEFIRNTDDGGTARPHPGRPREVSPAVVPLPHASHPPRSRP